MTLSSQGVAGDKGDSRLERFGALGLPCVPLRSQVEVLEYPELGMEAVWKIDVVDFPAFIVVDSKGMYVLCMYVFCMYYMCIMYACIIYVLCMCYVCMYALHLFVGWELGVSANLEM